jgi:hypothetical protein
LWRRLPTARLAAADHDHVVVHFGVRAGQDVSVLES